MRALFIKARGGLSVVTIKLLANEKVKFDSVHPVAIVTKDFKKADIFTTVSTKAWHGLGG